MAETQTKKGLALAMIVHNIRDVQPRNRKVSNTYGLTHVSLKYANQAVNTLNLTT
jgi:hypothetical protein